MKCSLVLLLILIGHAFAPTSAPAQSAEDIARALQDPLASIAALMTDNTVNFNTGIPDSTTGYNFQLQPVYAVSFRTFNFLPRAVIPIIGAPGGANFPNLPGQPPSTSMTWGLSDIILQTFFSPKSEGGWKWGVGPQFSLKTRTDSAVAGAGWGAGVGGVLVGDVGSLSVAVLASQHWSFDGDFSLATLQPMLFYNFAKPAGFTINYNNSITVDWKVPSGEKWSVPLGLGISQAFQLGAGHGLDVGVGGYYMVVRPEGGPSAQLKINISWLIPR